MISADAVTGALVGFGVGLLLCGRLLRRADEEIRQLQEQLRDLRVQAILENLRLEQARRKLVLPR